MKTKKRSKLDEQMKVDKQYNCCAWATMNMNDKVVSRGYVQSVGRHKRGRNNQVEIDVKNE